MPVAPGIEGRQFPEGALICNFPRGLMEPAQLVLMFHEFGHLLHGILAGRQRWVRFSGVATEMDFVEAPSEFLESLAREPEVLQMFARHTETAEPVPSDLVRRWQKASAFGRGIYARMQTLYSILSLRFHQADAGNLDP